MPPKSTYDKVIPVLGVRRCDMDQCVQKSVVGGWVGAEKGVGSTAQQLRLRDSMLADLRSQNKALAGTP